MAPKNTRHAQDLKILNKLGDIAQSVTPEERQRMIQWYQDEQNLVNNGVFFNSFLSDPEERAALFSKKRGTLALEALQRLRLQFRFTWNGFGDNFKLYWLMRMTREQRCGLLSRTFIDITSPNGTLQRSHKYLLGLSVDTLLDGAGEHLIELLEALPGVSFLNGESGLGRLENIFTKWDLKLESEASYDKRSGIWLEALKKHAIRVRVDWALRLGTRLLYVWGRITIGCEAGVPQEPAYEVYQPYMDIDPDMGVFEPRGAKETSGKILKAESAALKKHKADHPVPVIGVTDSTPNISKHDRDDYHNTSTRALERDIINVILPEVPDVVKPAVEHTKTLREDCLKAAESKAGVTASRGVPKFLSKSPVLDDRNLSKSPSAFRDPSGSISEHLQASPSPLPIKALDGTTSKEDPPASGPTSLTTFPSPTFATRSLPLPEVPFLKVKTSCEAAEQPAVEPVATKDAHNASPALFCEAPGQMKRQTNKKAQGAANKAVVTVSVPEAKEGFKVACGAPNSLPSFSSRPGLTPPPKLVPPLANSKVVVPPNSSLRAAVTAPVFVPGAATRPLPPKPVAPSAQSCSNHRHKAREDLHSPLGQYHRPRSGPHLLPPNLAMAHGPPGPPPSTFPGQRFPPPSGRYLPPGPLLFPPGPLLPMPNMHFFGPGTGNPLPDVGEVGWLSTVRYHGCWPPPPELMATMPVEAFVWPDNET